MVLEIICPTFRVILYTSSIVAYRVIDLYFPHFKLWLFHRKKKKFVKICDWCS